MRKLHLKKIKISKIDHINTIFGGNGDTEECNTDHKSKLRQNEDTIFVYVCNTNTGTDRRTMSGNTTGLAETDECGG
jgi:hypothetical protein